MTTNFPAADQPSLSCADARRQMALLAGSDLPADEAATAKPAVRNHLAGCPSCREHRAGLLVGLNALAGGREDSQSWVEAPGPGLWPEIERRIVAGNTTSAEPVRRPGPVAAAAVSLAAALAIAVVVIPPGGATPSPTAQTRPVLGATVLPVRSSLPRSQQPSTSRSSESHRDAGYGFKNF